MYDSIITFLHTTRTAYLQTGIDLVRSDGSSEDLPVVTSVLDCLRDLDLLDVIWTLQDVDIKTGRDVPGDVAMQWPDTGVVCLELDHGVGWGASIGVGFAQDLNITAGWVGWVGDGSIPDAISFGKDFCKESVHAMVWQEWGTYGSRGREDALDGWRMGSGCRERFG